MILPWVVIDWEEGEVVYGGGAAIVPGAGGGNFFSNVDPEDTCRPIPPGLEAIEGDLPTDPDALRFWDMSFAVDFSATK